MVNLKVFKFYCWVMIWIFFVLFFVIGVNEVIEEFYYKIGMVNVEVDLLSVSGEVVEVGKVRIELV